MERNSLAEKRVSLSIFNYHTWIEYDFPLFFTPKLLQNIVSPSSSR